jgi:hypothetical protein
MVAKPKRGRGRPRLIEDDLVNLIDMAVRGEIHTLAVARDVREGRRKLPVTSRSQRAVCRQLAEGNKRKAAALRARYYRAVRRLDEKHKRLAAALRTELRRKS